MTTLDGIPLFKGEAMLLSWGDTSSRGKTVTFALHEDDCGTSHPFRDLGTGKHGQRFQIVAVPITDEGEPVSPGSSGRDAPGSGAQSATPTPLKAGGDPGESKRERTLPELVGWRCNSTDFQNWLLWNEQQFNGEDTADVVRRICGVKSRKQVLPGTEAATKWLALETRFLEDTGRLAERRR